MITLKDLSGSFCYYRAMSTSRSQKGSAHLATVIVLIVTLVSSLGFAAWKNLSSKSNEASVAQTEQGKHEAIKRVADTHQKGLHEGYLVLENWGIKFKLPENSGEIRYYKEDVTNDNDSSELYSFTTKRVEELGEYCSPDSREDPIRLAFISRSDIKLDHILNATLANNEPINGYYYYMAGTQNLCANKGDELQTTDKSMIEKMLLDPVAIE
jgi:hypothetical protein